ncbi:MAG: hypothetical protein JEZ11_27795 [Desulfobacterales bacterium]|nr:hypothetical protein [Desulfobacterales bacterium]
MYRRSPLYLQLRNSGYTFRFSLPADVRKYFDRTEIKVSLGTRKFSEAKFRARVLSSRIHLIINRIREGNEMTLLTDEQIAEIVKRDFLDLLAGDEQTRTEGSYPECAGMVLEEFRKENRQCLAECDHEHLFSVARSLISKYLGLELPEDDAKNDFSIKKLTRELRKSFDRFLDVWDRRNSGDYSPEPSIVDGVFARPLGAPDDQAGQSSVPPEVPKQSPVPAISTTSSRTIDQIIDLYAEECKSTQKWKERTGMEVLSTFSLFKQVIGSERMIDSISRQDIAEFKKTILKLPPNMNKMKEYRNKSIAEIIRFVEKNDKERLSLVTVKKHLTRVKSLFDLAYNHGYIEKDPSRGISIDVQRKHQKEIGSFHNDDLYKLFNCETCLPKAPGYSTRKGLAMARGPSGGLKRLNFRSQSVQQ